ncbi:Protoheme IX farnesyltransferase, mitochondrial [Tilletia horrida]|nr:Protoheme IX farnesyltransferase, mitochondrial [Tilletia horrida]
MAQLVSSRLVIHSAHAARFVPASASSSASASFRPASRTFLLQGSQQRLLATRAQEGQSQGSRISAPTLAPSFFTAAYARTSCRTGGAARLAHVHTHAQAQIGTASAFPRSGSSTTGGHASASSTAERAGKAAYAPASDDPSLIESDLSPSSSAAAAAAAMGQSSSSAAAAASAAASSAALFRPAPTHSLPALLRTYQQLSKARLTFLVVLTAMAPYALCPSALSVAIAPGLGGSVGTLLALSAGTALCSASANAFNQLLEAPYDAQMPRTRARPLPRRALSPLHAFGFAVSCGMGGTALLYAAVNPLTACLGLANVVLYAGIYTPLKRLSMVNTWVGSAVGAIPPLMGWTACTGTLLAAPSDAAGWVLAALLFAWQFPHFNSLAHSLRAEYARGGYRMMSVLDPGLNRRVSLRYALLLLPLCSVALPLAGSGVDVLSWLGLGGGAAGASAALTATSAAAGPIVEPWAYALLSAPINAVMIHAAYKFWRHGTDQAARWCFWVSLVHLPAIMLLAMACKREMWNGVGEALGMGTTRVPAAAVGRMGGQGRGASAEGERERLARLNGDGPARAVQ